VLIADAFCVHNRYGDGFWAQTRTVRMADGALKKAMSSQPRTW
jgi:hypothetical protein